MTKNELRAHLFVAAVAVATTGAAIYALAAPLHDSG
jgi:hypothetical protein